MRQSAVPHVHVSGHPPTGKERRPPTILSTIRSAPNRKRRYGVVSVSLHDVEGHIADRFADILRAAGWPRATRSLVIREALLRLQEDLVDKTHEEIFRDFVDRQGRRLRGPNRESRR
jgi:hypothetical protein